MNIGYLGSLATLCLASQSINAKISEYCLYVALYIEANLNPLKKLVLAQLLTLNLISEICWEKLRGI